MPFCKAHRAVWMEGRVTPQGDASWKAAFMASPGPRSKKDAVLLILRGVCMGAADTVPGVSGGTIALITGIYEQLLAAIQSVNAEVFSRLFRLDLKGAVALVHARFLLLLFIGIALAVISLARIVSYLLVFHPVPTWSLFFGLIAASIWAVGRKVDGWGGRTGFMFLAGTALAYALVGLMPAATPETPAFIFLSGMLAICAMILPGISGAFILVLLGKYQFIVATLKNPFVAENMMVIAVFSAGCVAGLAGFSRILKFMLERYKPATLAFLSGLLLGSLRRIWPWKEGAMQRNVLPEASPDLIVPVCLMAAGLVMVLCLEWISAAKKDAGA